MTDKRKRPHIQVECNTPFLLKLKSDIQLIAQKKGITMAAYIKQLLIEARDKFPDQQRLIKP